MRAHPSPLVNSLHGSAGNLTARRDRRGTVLTLRTHPPNNIQVDEPVTSWIVDSIVGTGWTPIVGSWVPTSPEPTAYLAGYHRATLTGYAISQFVPTLPLEQLYHIYEWHPVDPTLHNNVLHQIRVGIASMNHYVNQAVNGGQWNFIASYTLNPATALVRNGGGGGVNLAADAIRFSTVLL